MNDYTPNGLLNMLIEIGKLKNDAALARMLEVAPPVISKIRHGTLKFGASLIIRAHLVSGMEVRAIMEYLPKEVV